MAAIPPLLERERAMDVTVIAIIGIAATASVGIGLFIFDHWYTRAMPEVGNTQVGEWEQANNVRIRHFGIVVTNRPTRWSWPQRKVAENLTTHLLIRGASVAEKTFHGMWTPSPGGREFTSPGAQISLAVGQRIEVPVVLKAAGQETCQLIHNKLDVLTEEYVLPEGTYLVVLTLVHGGKSTPYNFVLNNRTPELARLQLKGPVTRNEADHMIRNPAVYFPLGGTG